MGLFGKTPPPPARPETFWLVRKPHPHMEGAWVYQAVRESRDILEEATRRLGARILPWDALPGVKQVASDNYHGEVEVIGVAVGGAWAEWNLPCPQPPVPDAQPATGAMQVNFAQGDTRASRGDFVKGFVTDTVSKLYPHQWQNFGPGVRILADHVGIMVNIKDEDAVRFYAGVVSDLTFSEELCSHIAVINQYIPIGAFTLSDESRNHIIPNRQWTGWSLIYFMKVRERWVEQEAVSAKIIGDVLFNIPPAINWAVDYLSEHLRVPISRWDTSDDESWIRLAGHI